LPYWEDGGRDVEYQQQNIAETGFNITPLKGLAGERDFVIQHLSSRKQDVASKIEVFRIPTWPTCNIG
jgi:hypothetical protein